MWEIGTGFRPAESTENTPVGTIPVDAIFTPIRKINYAIEPTHLGRETSRERLRMEIWTGRHDVTGRRDERRSHHLNSSS